MAPRCRVLQKSPDQNDEALACSFCEETAAPFGEGHFFGRLKISNEMSGELLGEAAVGGDDIRLEVIQQADTVEVHRTDCRPVAVDDGRFGMDVIALI